MGEEKDGPVGLMAVEVTKNKKKQKQVPVCPAALPGRGSTRHPPGEVRKGSKEGVPVPLWRGKDAFRR